MTFNDLVGVGNILTLFLENLVEKKISMKCPIHQRIFVATLPNTPARPAAVFGFYTLSLSVLKIKATTTVFYFKHTISGVNFYPTLLCIAHRILHQIFDDD